jgi:hypothetical protein
MDFTHDALASGRRFRTLNLMEGYTRWALEIEVDTSLPGARMVRVLERLRLQYGAPERIQVDKRPGIHFTGRGPVGVRARRGLALHPSRQAYRQRADRELQRQVSG